MDRDCYDTPICEGCMYYEPHFFIVYNQHYNKSECKLTGKKVTLKKKICNFKEEVKS